MKIPTSPLLFTLALSSTALAAPTPQQPSSRPLLTPLLSATNEAEPASPSLSVNSPLLGSVKGDINLDAEVWGPRPRQMPGGFMRRWQKRQASNPASGLSAENIASTASNAGPNVNGAISTLGQSTSGLTSALGGLGLGSTVGGLTSNPLGAVGGLVGTASGAVGGVTGLLPLSGVTGLTGGLLGSTGAGSGLGGLLGSTNGILGSATGLLGSATGGLTGSSSGILGGIGLGQTVGGVIGTVSGLPVVGGLAGGALGSVGGVVTNLQASNAAPSSSFGSNPSSGLYGDQTVGILSSGVGGTAQALSTAQAPGTAETLETPQASTININQVPGLVANLGGGKYLLSSGQVVVASATGMVEGLLPTSAVQGLLGGTGSVLGHGGAGDVDVGGLASSAQGGLGGLQGSVGGLQGSLAGLEGQVRYVNIGGQVVSLNSAGQIIGILQSQPAVGALESQSEVGGTAPQSGLGQTIGALSTDSEPAAPVVPNGYSNVGQAQSAGLIPINYYDDPDNSTLPDMGNSTLPTNATGLDNTTMSGNMTSSDNSTTANMDDSSNPLSSFEYNSTSDPLLPTAYTSNDTFDPAAYDQGSDDTAPSNQSLQDNEGTDATSLVAQAMSGGESAAQPMVTGLSTDGTNGSPEEESHHRTYENVPWRRPAHPIAPAATTTTDVVVTATATMTATETVTATVTDSVTASASATASATDAGWGDEQEWGGWVTGTVTGNWAQATGGM